MNPEFFVKALAEKDFNLSSKQKEQFSIYYQELIETNKKVNLTRITEEEDVFDKAPFKKRKISSGFIK